MHSIGKVIHKLLSLQYCLVVVINSIFALIAAWWQQHGISCLELQQIAVRILSQTCSSLCFEHNWTPFAKEHSQRHNTLSQRKMADLLYVHYNLRLRERQLRKQSNESVSLDHILMEHLLDDWIVEPQKQGMQEDEV